jgi:hypothetical protein
MKMFDEILSLPFFEELPPVLIDVGASGEIHAKWKPIAKHSICIAFDGDERDFAFSESTSHGFKKLFVFHSLVLDKKKSKSKFYLTKSPYCSSTLEPDLKSLQPWSFADKFEVEKAVILPGTTISDALKQVKISYIDWFKTDSQGLDLRIFNSIPKKIRENIIAAEFEPGIIDAYHGEDKLYSFLQKIDSQNFWMSGATVKGAQRIAGEELQLLSGSPFVQKLISFSHKTSPGWVEMVYLNSFNKQFTAREYFLGWMFATIEQQYGFALRLARTGFQTYSHSLFEKLEESSIRRIRYGVLNKRLLNAGIQKIIDIVKRVF